MDFEHTSDKPDNFEPSKPNLKTLDCSSSTNKPVAAPHATEDDGLDEDSICDECRQVDWDSLPTLAENSEHSVTMLRTFVRNIGANHEQLATSSCRICRILSVVKPQSLDHKECMVEARPLSAFTAYALSEYGDNKTALHVRPRGNIFESHDHHSRCLVVMRRDCEDFSSRTITSTSVDYDWLRGLARSCEKSHKGYCRPSWFDPVAVSGLKVIEVSSRTIIEAPAGCRYVALSYVWGKQPDVSVTLHLQRPPPLIEDAISVTIAMGYKYLWIDRYVSL